MIAGRILRVLAFGLPVLFCQCGGDDGSSGDRGGDSEREKVAEEVKEKKDDGDLIGAARAVNQARVKTLNLNAMRHFAIGAHMASSVSGSFPADLEALREAAELPESVGLTDPNDGKVGIDPVYYSKVKPGAAGNTILLACPFTNPDGTRTVAYSDGAVEHIPEADYKKKTGLEE